MVYEAKIAEKKEFERLYNSPEERARLGLNSWDKVFKHCKVSPSTGWKWLHRHDTPKVIEKPSFVDELSSDENKKLLQDALKKAIKLNKVKAIETYLKLIGELDKKEIKQEYSASDRIRVAEAVRDGLYRGYEVTGSCPVCHRPKVLDGELRLASESKPVEKREVATLDFLITPSPLGRIQSRDSNSESPSVGDKLAG